MAKRARPHVIALRVSDAELALIEERMRKDYEPGSLFAAGGD